jgi:hypothetical protein
MLEKFLEFQKVGRATEQGHRKKDRTFQINHCHFKGTSQDVPIPKSMGAWKNYLPYIKALGKEEDGTVASVFPSSKEADVNIDRGCVIENRELAHRKYTAIHLFLPYITWSLQKDLGIIGALEENISSLCMNGKLVHSKF